MPPDHKPHHKPKHLGPKERELAVTLTVAVLNASKIEGDLHEIEKLTLGVYDRMLGAVSNGEFAQP